MEPRPYGYAGGTISDPPVGVGVLDDPPSRYAPTQRHAPRQTTHKNRRGGVPPPPGRTGFGHVQLIPHAKGARPGRRGRRPLRVCANHTRVRNRDGGAPGSVRPTGCGVRYHHAGGGRHAGWGAEGTMGPHVQIKSRFSLERHSRFFWQGQKKWGGIMTFTRERVLDIIVGLIF